MKLGITRPAWLRAARTEAWSRQGGKCLYCTVPISRGEATADHVQPQSKGGSDEPHNIAAACGPCNRAKGHMEANYFQRMIDGKIEPKNFHLAVIAMHRRIEKRISRAERRVGGCLG